MNCNIGHIVVYLFLSLLCASGIQAQRQAIADSLIGVYEELPPGDTSALRILRLIASNHTNPQQKIDYSNKLMEEAERAQSVRYLYYAYLNEGQAYRLLGDFDVAIYSLFKALKLAERARYPKGEAAAHTALADVYSAIGNHNSSVMYYKKALRNIAFNDSTLLATVLLNLGDEYYLSHMYDSALNCFKKSRRIYELKGNDQSGVAYNLGNIGLVQAELGNFELASEQMSQAIQLLNELGDHYGVAIFLSYMSEIYQKKGMLSQAKMLADSSRNLSRKHGLKAEVKDNGLRLADIYAMDADYETAYNYHQQYMTLRDSISHDEIYSRVENVESAFELAKKQSEVNELKTTEKNQRLIIVLTIGAMMVLATFALVVYRYYRSKARVNRILEEQKEKLESLNHTKDKFFSIISHDLRGPISSFHGVSSMIKYFVEQNDQEQLLEVADHIDKSVDGLSSLLDNLLAWAMQQQGHFTNVPEKLNAREIVEEIIMAFDNMARSKSIHLESSIPKDICIWADKNAAMTIIRNLVNNALKFTPQKGQVTVTARSNGEFAEVIIADSGIGIPDSKINKIFKLQDRGSTYGTEGEKGLGLGLQLVNEFVMMVGGKIAIESEESVGTRFIVSFPQFELEQSSIDHFS